MYVTIKGKKVLWLGSVKASLDALKLEDSKQQVQPKKSVPKTQPLKESPKQEDIQAPKDSKPKQKKQAVVKNAHKGESKSKKSTK